MNSPIAHVVEFTRIVEEPVVVSSDDDGNTDGDSENEPQVLPAPFTLDNIPDPVYPCVGHGMGPKEPLPMNPSSPDLYWVILKGFKVGIFLES